jgi:hypothetical protein
LIRDLPVLLAAFKKGFDAPVKEEGFFDFLKPGEKQIKKLTAGLSEMGTVLGESFKAFGDTKFLDIQARVDQLVKSFVQAKNDAKALKTAGKEDVAAAVFVPFAPGADQKAKIKQLSDAVNAAEDRLAKAKRQATELAVSAGTDISLQDLRRDLTLIEQGFLISGGAVAELRSALDQVNQFLGDNLAATTKGAEANFVDLSSRVQTVTEQVSASVFGNLRAQLDVAKVGFENFKKAAAAARAELEATEVTPHFTNADKALAVARDTFDKILRVNQEFVDKAQAQLVAAQTTGKPEEIRAAQANVTEALQAQESGNRRAEQERDFNLAFVFAERRLALANKLKLEQQESFQISTEQRKIEADQLRIEQQINAEVGKLLQQNVKARDAILAVRQRAAAAQPRTRLETEGGDIQTTRIALTVEVDKAVGALSVLTEQITLLQQAGAAVPLALLENASAIRVRIDALNEEKDAALRSLEWNRALATSWEAVGNAASATINALSDAMLAAFEGKTTEFKQVFKGIADSLFKDSMKDVFQTFKVTFQRGFENAMKGLGIESSMASTLGPAFLAGFALIASFVLGQLMSGGSSSSAGNPNVGVQSTEQVRGLIGGESQIPIGLIGESLQSALVPTNLLLSRIASGVDRLSFGGIDPSVIESTIATSISDALQIQLSAT